MSQFARHMMRDAYPADAAIVSAIYFESFPTTMPAQLGRIGRWWSRRVWMRRLATPDSLAIMAVSEGSVAGFAYATASRKGMAAIHTVRGVEWLVIPLALLLTRPRATFRRIHRLLASWQASRTSRALHESNPTDTDEPLVGWIEPYAVASFARGQSIGRRMVRTVVERAAEHGWHRVKAQVDRANIVSIHALRKIGQPEVRTTSDSVYFTFDPADLRTQTIPQRTQAYRKAA